MSELTPCPSCQRHIRVDSAVCPFCDATTVPSALSEARALRRAPVKKGVKRAVLFAIGAGLTSAACADGDEPDTSDTTSDMTTGVPSDTTDMAQPVYGAPVDTTDTTNATSDDSDTTELAQPEYGAPVITTDMTDDTATDSGSVIVPVYGSPPIAPDASISGDAGVDAGVDAGTDAGDDGGIDASDSTSASRHIGSSKSSDGTTDETGPIIQPVYGAPITPQSAN